MHEIRPWLCVGTRQDAADRGLLYARGIGAVLQLAHEVRYPDIASRFIPVEDAEAVPFAAVRDAVDFVLGQRIQGRKVLIACSGGFSRSVALACVVLREAEGLPLADGLREIREIHPQAQPHPAVWAPLCEFYQEPLNPRPSFGLRRKHRLSRR